MIVRRTYPRSFAELLAGAQEAAGEARSVTIQAGHFLLYYDIVEDRLLPCISSELTSPRHDLLRREAGAFPTLSWALGLRLLDALGAPAKQVMIVVNDWQYLPKVGVDRHRFYESFKRLPAGYTEELQNYAGRVTLLQPTRGTGTAPFFGEMNLRNQYRKRVERMLESGGLPAEAIVEHHGDDVVCSLPDAVGRRHEVYCSNKTGDCAAEIAQMLLLARQATACDCFINLHPAVCREFVERGTELGEELLGNGIGNVLNVGLPTSDVRSEADLLSGCEVAWHQLGAGDRRVLTMR